MPLAYMLDIFFVQKSFVVIGNGNDVVIVKWYVAHINSFNARLGIYADERMVGVLMYVTSLRHFLPSLVCHQVAVFVNCSYISFDIFSHARILYLFYNTQYRHRQVGREALRVTIHKPVETSLAYDENLFHGRVSVGAICSSSKESLVLSFFFPSSFCIAFATSTFVGYQYWLSAGVVGQGTSGQASERGALLNTSPCCAAFATISEPMPNAPLVVSTVRSLPVFLIEALIVLWSIGLRDTRSISSIRLASLPKSSSACCAANSASP